MKSFAMKIWMLSLVAAASMLAAFGVQQIPQLTHQPMEPDSNGEIPSIFQESNQSFDYVKREEMIPMRDGVKLFTLILIPRSDERMPILLTRTPYNAARRATRGADRFG